MTVLSFV